MSSIRRRRRELDVWNRYSRRLHRIAGSWYAEPRGWQRAAYRLLRARQRPHRYTGQWDG